MQRVRGGAGVSQKVIIGDQQRVVGRVWGWSRKNCICWGRKAGGQEGSNVLRKRTRYTAEEGGQFFNGAGQHWERREKKKG